MRDEKWGRLKLLLLGLGVLMWLTGAFVSAQETPPRLYITGSDTSSPPSIELRAYGIDSTGSALDLMQTALSVKHNNLPVGNAEPYGFYPAGTFTLFLIDAPTGVADQIPAIKDAIIEYASSPTMMEQVDYVAIYQVGESAAIELLPSDTFYNGVRNLFATPLAPESGPTALVDSLMGLLEQVPDLKPRPDMFASLVVISDGTDVVSTRFDPEDVVERAAQSDFPIHTIWLNNADLSAASQEEGRIYLADMASASRGLSVRLEQETDLRLIWNRIASFRDQVRIRYTANGLSGGTFPVTLSLADDPTVNSETTVTIAGNTPMIQFNIPLESRVLTLPDLDEPVKLRFSTTVTWLDGVERQLTAAQLIVNGMSPQSIPVENISQFDVEIDNLVFGDNTVQIAILDEQGLRVTSPLILLTVKEGASASIPDELKPGRGIGGVIATIFLALVAFGALAGVSLIAWQRRWFSRLPNLLPRGPSARGRLRRPRPPVIRSMDMPEFEGDQGASPAVIAQLDVLESVSHMPPQIGLTRTNIRIGRSPAQSDIAFQDDITVSRLHASLMLEGSHYRIFDEKSTSGTWVNEQQVPEYGIQLMDGDEIHLGAVHLRFRQTR